MQVTSIQPNAPVPATAPLTVEAPAVACEEAPCLAKDALVQSSDASAVHEVSAAQAEAAAPAQAEKTPVESIFNWAINWFNISFLQTFHVFNPFSRDEEDEEEARAAGLERQGAERRSSARRMADKSLQARIKEGLSTVKAVDEARKFHQAIEQMTQRPREAQA